MALESLPYGFGEFAMDGFGSVWNHQNDLFSQNTEELKQRLFQTTSELEALRAGAQNELRKKDEAINKLINLVKLTTKERDEAKDQLNSLLSYLQSKNLINSNSQQPVNSSLTDSDSFSSPSESFYHADSSHISNAHNNNKYDNGSIIIDELAKKRPLPEKGRLLQAVMNAGPLLQTLMVAGPLPTWRNPPPVQKFQVPPHLAVGSPQSSQLCMKRPMMLPLDYNGMNEDYSAKRLRAL